MAQRVHSPSSYYAPWEKAFGRILTPFEEFIRQETAGSFVLMACTAMALMLANSPLAEAYDHLLHTDVTLSIGVWQLDHTVHHWINDGLMALFFFVVGLEIKREVVVGDLADPRAAVLPIVAAIGGMVVPAVMYAVINTGGEGIRGWGIPMATDIAFALGVMALLGSRVPKSLFTFLVAVAIVDDLGAVAVIAIFYTEQIVLSALALAGLCLGLLIVFNLAGVRHPLPLSVVGGLVWLAMLESGVHATIAGVLVAWTVPVRPKLEPRRFSQYIRNLMNKFDRLERDRKTLIQGQQQRAILQAIETGVHKVESPLQRLEHTLHIPAAFVVVPLFALANAGIAIDPASFKTAIVHPVTLGVVVGLLGGKLVGVAGLSSLAVWLGLAQLPAGCRMSHMVGIGLLAGIGFTMSIFIAELGFRAQPELLLNAKMGVLGASVVAGAAGYAWLYKLGAAGRSPRRRSDTAQ
jgi:NhaA family Na+:H+ antiporter